MSSDCICIRRVQFTSALLIVLLQVYVFPNIDPEFNRAPGPGPSTLLLWKLAIFRVYTVVYRASYFFFKKSHEVTPTAPLLNCQNN